MCSKRRSGAAEPKGTARLGLALVALAMLVSRSARADTVDASVTTLFAGRQEPRDGQVRTVVPTYELVSIRAADLTNPWFRDLKLVVSGWGAVDPGGPGEPRDGRLLSADLDVAFAEGKLFDRHLTLRAGRQLWIGGSARNAQFDGLSADLRVFAGLGLSVWGGSPVTPRFATPLGDVLVGTRIFWRHSFDSEIGASFVHVAKSFDQVTRQEVGVDARWVPVDPIAIGGYAFFSTVEARMAEADLGVQWRPVRPFEMLVDYRHTAPDLFLPRTSIFSVFSDRNRDELGGALTLRPLPRVRILLDYHLLLVDGDASLGHDGGGKLRILLGASGTSVGAEARYLRTGSNGFLQGRVSAIVRLSSAFLVTLDADAFRFAEPVNGQDLSFTGTATVGWGFLPGWHAVVAGLGGFTPFLERRFELMVKLRYDLAFGSREVRR